MWKGMPFLLAMNHLCVEGRIVGHSIRYEVSCKE